MLVGVAEVMIVARTDGFEKELRDSTDPAFTGLKQDAETAGEDAGAGLRTGVNKEASKLEGDLGDVGAASGVSLREGVKDGSHGLESDLSDLGAASGVGLREGVKEGTHGLESDLGDLGAASGLSLRSGVTDETGKLADDVEKDGERAGEGLHKGMSSGLSKLASVISSTGLPLGGLTSGLEKAGDAAKDTEGKSSELSSGLSHLGGVALAGVAGAGLAVAAVGIHMAEGMQTADTAIAGAAGTSVTAAKEIGNAFLGTAGQSEIGGEKMAQAFAGVAGQLKSTEGGALNASQALQVMNASGDLATAKQMDLGDATSTVAGIMQAFQLKTGEAAHVSDVLYTASNATGQSVDALGAQLLKVRAKMGDTSGSVGDLAGLLVDLAKQGIVGRPAMTVLSSGMNTLEKSATGVSSAMAAQKTAYDSMSPSLQKLADSYRAGTMTSADFTKATDALPPQQAALAKAFATSTTAVQTAQLKFKEMGVTTFDASGKFVGMGSIIDQLHPKFALMNQDQQQTAATTLFGAGAAHQMIKVITAGPAAYDKATESVNKMGAAHAAAAQQSHTLHGEEKTLEAEMGDLAAKIGAVLIPIITAMVGSFVKATTFVVDHKAALIALGLVVTGVLGPAIAVFTVTKMKAFGDSFTTAGGYVKTFASGVQSSVAKVIAAFTEQNTAAEGAEAKMATASEGMNTSFAGTATAATTAAATVEAEVGTEATEVTAADTTIEAENVAAGESFTALLGPIGLAVGAVILFHKQIASIANTLGFGSMSQQSGQIAAYGKALNSHSAGAAVSGAVPAGARTAPGHSPIPVYSGGNVAGGSSVVAAPSVVAAAPSATSPGGGPIQANTAGGGLLGEVEQFLGAAGFNKTAVAGIYGNARQESSDNPNEAGGGMWQQVSNFGSGTGGSLQHQMQTMLPQIESLKGILNDAGSAANAAKIFMQKFEEPQLHGKVVPVENLPNRVAGANAAYSQLGGGAASSGVPAAVTAMLNEAKALIGTPYSKANHAGAFTETSKAVRQLGIDCSGFVSVLLKKGGVDINQALNTQTLPSVLKPGRGKDVTVFDRHTGPAADEHALIEIMGKYFESGGNTAINPSGRVKQLTTAQAKQELAGGGFQAYHPTLSSAGGGAAALSAQTLVKERNALTVEIAKERAAVDKEIVSLENSVKGKGVSTQKKDAVASQISELRSGLQIEAAQQRSALADQTATQKAELTKQTTDGKAGASVLNKMLTAIHAGTLKSLQTALTAAHTAGLSKIERDLDHDHSSALASLGKELVAVHSEALAAEGKAEIAAFDAALLKGIAAKQAAETTALNKQSTAVQDTAKRQADLIADATKVYLDGQAEVGLSGTALIAAKAQTALDQVTQSQDQAIDAAQMGVDAAVNGSALAQAQAANVLARAQASATVSEAQQQAVLDKANAAASSTTSTSSTTNAPVNISIYGNGAMTAAQLFQEVGWVLRTGALPVAAPAPAPAAA